MTRKMNDLTDRVFGRLTAVKVTPNRKNGQAVWECKCKCGNKVEIRSTCLVNGVTRSCGCLRHDLNVAKADKESERLSKLIAQGMSLVEVAKLEGVSHQRIHQKIKRLYGSVLNLRHHLTKHRWTPEQISWLGSFSDPEVASRLGISIPTVYNKRKELNIPKSGITRLVDLTNQRFGRLVVVKEAGRQRGAVLWECWCDCGKTVVVSSGNLKGNKQRSCGCLLKDMYKTGGGWRHVGGFKE